MHLTKPLIAIAVALVVAGCSAEAPDPGPKFDDEGQRETACMAHQPAAPGARYTDTTLRRTGETLLVLRYYTTNGTKPYCDGAGPTDTDRAWAKLYVALGADRTNVAALLK